jgi:UDP-N-acetylglucosamine--N-acetylmuramyl-(pentapeptide) pyrophosphoryl-undecaprenol N-acetylglucosamine transferase
VIGFGGYPTVPPVLAASLLGIPTIIHDQNAVLGKANRFLSARVSAIACGFPEPGGVPNSLRSLVHVTGNPVRPTVLEAARSNYPSFDEDCLRLLVTGGSQGAKVMSDIVPAAIALLAPDQRAKLAIVQQARGEDEARVRDAYQRMGLAADVAPFFKDLPQRIAQAHLVIARAGASTVSELAVIGRPAILVPFPFALDQDQAANARQLETTGAVDVIAQASFTPEWLAARLEAAMNEPERLRTRAAAAKAAGVPDAASRLADLVQSVMARAIAETAK